MVRLELVAITVGTTFSRSGLVASARDDVDR
jgi:hypothetical protein